MRRRTVLLGSFWVGLVSGALCGAVLSVLFSPHLLVGYLFSILVYSAAGGLAALLFSTVFVRLIDAAWLLRISAGLVSAFFAFFVLVYWGNRWLLAGIPFSSAKSLVFDAGALAVSLFLGACVGGGIGRWLDVRLGHERRHRIDVWVVVAVLLFLAVPGIWLIWMAGSDRPESGRAAGGRRSVLLISIDALRADHLGCYGYERETSPAIDRLAHEGVRFETAFCPVPATGPSHATMLTGLTPQAHGARHNGSSLAESVTSLAEILSGAGYATGGFTTNVLLGKRFGFDQGFETYVESGHVERLRPVTLGLLVQTLVAKEIVDKLRYRYGSGRDQTILSAAKWASGNAERPFFLFLHLLDPHEPFEPLEPYRSRFPPDTRALTNSLWARMGRDVETAARLISLYDGEIAGADDKVAELLGLLDRLGTAHRTLVVLTADHGENMADHEPFFRHVGVYDSSLRIPLILRYPGVLGAGVTVPGVVENSSILPTVLSLIGESAPADVEGESLVPLIEGTCAAWDRAALAYSGKEYGLRADAWKVVIDFSDGSRSLYDLANDPGEEVNVFSDHETRGARMADSLLARIQRLEGELPKAQEDASPFEGLDRQTRERLRALGYIQ